MLPSEAEKEFEEIKNWFNGASIHYGKLVPVLREPNAYTRIRFLLIAYSRQQEKIEKLKERIKKIISPNSNFGYHYIHKTILDELKKLLDET